MSGFVIDVEADGPCPGLYSMVSFGVVAISDDHTHISRSFYGEVRPISDLWVPEALAVSDISREVHESYGDPADVMKSFSEWIVSQSNGRPVMWSDNPAFDWQFMNYYLWKYTGGNVMGHSARRIGDLYAGMQMDSTKAGQFKKLRDTKHTHNPVDDARGNVEALLKMRGMGLKLPTDMKQMKVLTK
jgi:hypothetical protein